MTKSKQLYRQCKMEMPSESGGKRIHVAWIPTKFAHVGKTIQIKMTEDVWEGPWTVVEAGGSTRDYDEMSVQRDAQKRWENVLDHGVRD